MILPPPVGSLSRKFERKIEKVRKRNKNYLRRKTSIRKKRGISKGYLPFGQKNHQKN